MATESLQIGHVIGVQGDQVEVAISLADLSIRHSEKDYRVGQVGTYITLPRGARTLIAYVIGVKVEHDHPGATPSPRRVSLTCQLIGTISGERFSRGVNDYPIPSEAVHLAVDRDFAAIFGEQQNAIATDGVRRSFSMGRFAVNTDFEVRAVGKDFFARHVAVMGNSGSGKSVTTAKIIHEALQLPHAQVLMFDMHGEYLNAFSDEFENPLPNVTYLSDRNLVLPYWLLAYDEFEQLFIDRSNQVDCNAQRLFLRHAFEKLKQTAAEELGLRGEMTIDTPVYYSLEQLLIYAKNMNAARFVTNTPNYAFSRLGYRQLPPEKQEALLMTQPMEFNSAGAEGETPHATYFGKLLGLINSIEARRNDRRFDFLMRPFEQAQCNIDLADKMHCDNSAAANSRVVSAVIRQLLGQTQPRRNLTIIDLSGLPFEVVDVTVAVLTRTLFDFNFWSPVNARQPVLMVYEEAHNYLPRRPIEGRRSFAKDAVEKVAKEGRKYGVSAMIVSQRPSEISETVLSQCNSMVLMRLNNPDDQEYAARVVSDQFRSLISLLPSLRPGEGFIIGDAVLMPMRTLIDMPPRNPQSASLDYFKLWGEGREITDADGIIERWWRQERSTPQSASPPGSQSPDTTGGSSLLKGRFELQGALRAEAQELSVFVPPQTVLDSLEDESGVPPNGPVGNDDSDSGDAPGSAAAKMLAQLASKISGLRPQ